MSSVPNPPLNSPQAESSTGKSSVAWASYFTRLTAFINSLTTSFAPSSATYITRTANGELSAEQALASLATGYMKVATGTGTITSTTTIPTTDLSGTITNAQIANTAVTDLSGTNTGDQTNISGNAASVTTNANLTGHVTSTGNAAILGSFTVAQLSAAISDADISGTNTGDQTNISGNAATVTTNANLTGHVTSIGNAAVLGSFTVAQLSTAISDANISGTNTGDQTLSDATISVTDITTNNVSSTAHGFMSKFPNNTTTFYRGDGTYNAVGLTNGITGVLPIANGGNGVGAIPSFDAYQNAGTAVLASAFTKVLFAVETWDVGSYFTSSKYTPGIAGIYMVTAQVSLTGTNVAATNRYVTCIYKNGALYRVGQEAAAVATSTYTSIFSGMVALNGSTDYIEIYMYNSNAALTVTSSGDIHTAFAAVWVGPSS